MERMIPLHLFYWRHIVKESLDKYIYMFLEDPLYEIREDSTIWRKNKYGVKQMGSSNKIDGYIRIGYKDKLLKAHRIIYAKFVGQLDSKLVIDHIDDNPSNNLPSNLRQITDRENTRKKARPPGKPEHNKRRSQISLDLLDQIVEDPYYDIRKDGTIWTKIYGYQWRIGYIIKDEWKQTGLSLDDKGYYVICYRKHNLQVSNVIYSKFSGPLDSTMVIDHKDDNPKNNSLSNLQQVTYARNARKRKTSIITEEKAESIREEFLAGSTRDELAAKYKMGSSNIGHIINKRTW